ncbi:MAG: PTS sugar transporter subunit IIA [Spirochaetales bacterium]|nr:PTS sugar transporter subunit IIA [Spirochaetales bacterium]
MLSPAEILDDRCILLDLRVKRKKDVIAALVESLAAAGHIANAKQVTKNVLLREKTASTGVGHSAAIPHWLSVEIDKTVMAFGRTVFEVQFGAIDGKPVRLFCLIVGPADRPNEHLQLLSRLSRILRHEECIDALLAAEEKDEVRRIFSREEET